MRVYRVRAAEASEDPRRTRERNLEDIAKKELKDAPTVPAVSANGAVLSDSSVTPRGALELPTTHCSFVRCKWHGNAEADLCAHVLERHRDQLESVASTLTRASAERDKSEEMMFISAHNEAAAKKVREGRPSRHCPLTDDVSVLTRKAWARTP